MPSQLPFWKAIRVHWKGNFGVWDHWRPPEGPPGQRNTCKGRAEHVMGRQEIIIICMFVLEKSMSMYVKHRHAHLWWRYPCSIWRCNKQYLLLNSTVVLGRRFWPILVTPACQGSKNLSGIQPSSVKVFFCL